MVGQTDIPIGGQKSKEVVVSEARDRVLSHQLKSKLRFDSRPKVRPSAFQVGDLIKIRIPRLVSKGRYAFSKPFRVVKINKKSLITQDGKCWGFKRVCHYAGIQKESGEMDSEDDYPLNVESIHPILETDNRSYSGSEHVSPKDHSPIVQDSPRGHESRVPGDSTYSIADRVKLNPRPRVPSRKVWEGGR